MCKIDINTNKNKASVFCGLFCKIVYFVDNFKFLVLIIKLS